MAERGERAGVIRHGRAAAVAAVLAAASTQAGCATSPDDTPAASMAAIVTDARLLTSMAVARLRGSPAPVPLAPAILLDADAMSALLASAEDDGATVDFTALRDARDGLRRSVVALPTPEVVETATIAEGALDDLPFRPGVPARVRAFCALGRWAFAVAQAEQPPSARPGSAQPAQELIDDGERRLEDDCA